MKKELYIIVLLITNFVRIESMAKIGRNLNAELEDQCLSGNKLDRIESLIRQGADPSIRIGRGQRKPLLNVVIDLHKEEHAQLLINNGASLTNSDSNGLTAVHCAARIGSVSLIKQLINRGSNIDAIDAHGNTPLLYAVTNKRLEAIEELLNNNASVDTAFGGRSVLIAAIETNPQRIDIQIFQLLMNPVAYASTPTNTLTSDLAKGYDGLKKVPGNNSARPNININPIDANGRLLLNTAIHTRNTRIMDLLLEARADVNITERTGNTPLFEAIQSRNINYVQSMLIHGARPNFIVNNMTPCDFANQMGEPQIEQLIRQYNGMSSSQLREAATKLNNKKVAHVIKKKQYATNIFYLLMAAITGVSIYKIYKHYKKNKESEGKSKTKPALALNLVSYGKP